MPGRGGQSNVFSHRSRIKTRSPDIAVDGKEQRENVKKQVLQGWPWITPLRVWGR